MQVGSDNDHSVRFHKKRDGILMIKPDGTARFLTLYERMFRAFTGRLPQASTPKDPHPCK